MLRRKLGVCAFALLLFGVLTPRATRAHFQLQAPPSWMSQDSFGLPEKLGPCGDEEGGTPTGIVTAFQSGQTITVTINEIIFHPGHYRIAMSVTDRSQLPPEPIVTPNTTSPCGSVPVENPPVFPVLADDVFDHTAPFTTPQSTTITLPSNVTCSHCTLQVIEFMSDHPLNNPGGCFYHHCADFSLGTVAVDGGSGDGAPSDASSGNGDGGATNPTTGGCSCTTATASSPSYGGFAGAALAVTLLARRRRPSKRASEGARSAESSERRR